jgi:hypothetical protein
MTMAQAQFHSSFLERIERATAIYDVDPKVLIIEVSKLDRVNPSEKMIQEVAARLGEPKTAGVGQA